MLIHNNFCFNFLWSPLALCIYFFSVLSRKKNNYLDFCVRTKYFVCAFHPRENKLIRNFQKTKSKCKCKTFFLPLFFYKIFLSEEGGKKLIFIMCTLDKQKKEKASVYFFQWIYNFFLREMEIKLFSFFLLAKNHFLKFL